MQVEDDMTKKYRATREINYCLIDLKNVGDVAKIHRGFISWFFNIPLIIYFL